MAWVSLAKSLSEYDRKELLLNASLSVHSGLLESLRRHLLEIDVAAAKDLRSFLRSAREQLENLAAAEELESFGSRFEQEWGTYFEKTDAAFRRIEKQFDETAQALENTIASLQRESRLSAGERFNEQISRLRHLATLDLPKAVRESLEECAQGFEQCINDLEMERKLLVVQLRDEIRTLQRSLEMAKHPAGPASLTGLLSRRELENAVAELIRSRRPFTLVYVWLRNLRRLERELSSADASRLVATVAKRIAEPLPRHSTVGRWSDDEFCALVELTGPPALELSRELRKRLETRLPLGDNPADKTVALFARVGLVGPQSDGDPKQFFLRADRLMKTLQGAA